MGEFARELKGAEEMQNITLRHKLINNILKGAIEAIYNSAHNGEFNVEYAYCSDKLSEPVIATINDYLRMRGYYVKYDICIKKTWTGVDSDLCTWRISWDPEDL